VDRDTATADADAERITQEFYTPTFAPQRAGKARIFLRVLVVCIDVVMLTAAFVLGYAARTALPISPVPSDPPPLVLYIPTIILHVLIIVLMFYVSRLYHQRRVFSRIDQARHILGVVTIGSVLVSGMQELIFKTTVFEVDYPRSMFFYVLVFSVAFALVGREIYRLIQNRLRMLGFARDNLLIVGEGRIAREITQRIKDHPALGYNIVGVVTDQLKPKRKFLGVPVLGQYRDLPQLIDAHGIEQVILAPAETRRAEIVEMITLCQRGRVDIKVYPDMFAYMAGDLNVDDLDGTPLLTVRDIALRGWKLSLKRALDFLGALCGLILLSPPMLLTAVMIRFESKGPVFFCQERMGLDGRPFYMIKFRSMRHDAESKGPGWTIKDDPRVTRLGRLMRRTSWDEIPQLINVLIGQMSLVGPRPERPVYVQAFRQNIPRYMERHREKSGMTGWAQVNGFRGDTDISERTAYDLWYVENWSLWLDIKIILRTIRVAFFDRSAY
jgi:exopolysaccharide biosynthesis polyprenyl glycosylphosphotransferase